MASTKGESNNTLSSRPKDSLSLLKGWEKRKLTSYIRYIPPSLREELWFQFEQVQQGQMSVTDYKARFSELSHHSLMILPTDSERVWRFVAGLHSVIQATMAQEVEMRTSYRLVVDITWRIEGVHQQNREQAARDK
ncbi:uncharacterized protein [Nicotiana tomentosiformis]|uniref:uncharacterized protein n=1 Tax=Nicotiana tomentosiformis TaxID=4098 RepID=UPI00388CE13A